MSVYPWLVPGSLRNLEPADGVVTGFRFAFRINELRTMFYAVHRVALILDGAPVKNANLRLTYRGMTVRAESLPETTWVCLRGEVLDVAVDYPGGLSRGKHRIRLEAVFGGEFFTGLEGKALPVCDFETEF